MWKCTQRRQLQPERQTKVRIKRRSSAEYRRIRSDTTPGNSARWEKCSLPLLRKWQQIDWGIGAGMIMARAGRTVHIERFRAANLMYRKGSIPLTMQSIPNKVKRARNVQRASIWR